MTVKVGINGFGRIGRLVFRAAWNHPEVEIVAINDLADGATIAHLLKYDSVHGRFGADITAQNDQLQVNGNPVAIRSIKEPDKIDWRKLGIDIVAECTGLFRDRERASRHHLGLGVRAAQAGKSTMAGAQDTDHASSDTAPAGPDGKVAGHHRGEPETFSCRGRVVEPRTAGRPLQSHGPTQTGP